MTMLIACDLDRTLIYSRLAAGAATASDHDLICVEYYDGAPLSFMTRGGAAMLRAVTAAATFVPTTTRTIEQYQRVNLPGAPHRYAITSNGGNILIDSQPDQHWRTQVEGRIEEVCAPLDLVATELQRQISVQWVRNFRVAENLFCYLVVDLAAVPTGFVSEWSQWCSECNWTVSMQGRKIYTVPAVLCKSVAVAEIRRRLEMQPDSCPPTAVLAAGDGALDAELLRYADLAMRPRHGELQITNFESPGVLVSDETGIAAGEEILRWMLIAIREAARTVRRSD